MGWCKIADVTISDVAAHAKVSRSTVSRVLNNSINVSEETRDAVLKAIEDLGYKPSEVARSLRVKKSKTVGVIVSNILNPFFSALVRGIEDVMGANHYTTILCNSDENLQKELNYIKTLSSKMVDGLIIAGAGSDEKDYSFAKNIPIVLVDRRLGNTANSVFDTILVDNYKGSYEAVEHLIQSGYERIGIISGTKGQTTGYERLKGYKDALLNYNIPIDPNLIRHGSFLGEKAGELFRAIVFHGKCDSIFVANNLMLLGVLEAAEKLKLSIPNDIGLVVFDDLQWMQHSQPKITAIKQPTYEMGTTAAKFLLSRITKKYKGEPRECILPVELVIRDSSRKSITK